MKQIVENTESNILDSFLGEIITVFCCRYIYTGKLIKIDDRSLVIGDCAIVYETGDFGDNEWKDAQSLNTKEWVISRESIESYGKLPKK